MDIRVTGQNMQTGEALQGRVRSKLEELCEKYNTRAISTTVVVSPFGQGMVECKMHSHFGKGIDFHCTARDHDAIGAFESAYTSMEKQWRRQKRKSSDHHVEKPEVTSDLADEQTQTD